MTRPLRTSADDATSHYERFPQPVTPEPNTAPRFVARIVALAARHPNDSELGAAVRALVGGE
jgi:hypothetical protein